jgi:CRISPR-associated exonuclease Cas4
VEFLKIDEGAAIRLARFEGVRGLWQPFPVEYKRGKPKKNNCDKVQLCAQALCLEEMLDADVPSGALFYGQTKRRLSVDFTPELRAEARRAIVRFRQIVETKETPAPLFGPKCGQCSLIEICQPEAFGRSARDYVNRMVRQALT